MVFQKLSFEIQLLKVFAVNLTSLITFFDFEVLKRRGQKTAARRVGNEEMFDGILNFQNIIKVEYYPETLKSVPF